MICQLHGVISAFDILTTACTSCDKEIGAKQSCQYQPLYKHRQVYIIYNLKRLYVIS